MRVALCSAVWNRIELGRIWWKALVRIRQQMVDAGLEASIWVAGSEAEHRELCAQSDGHWIPAQNRPLGKKFNRVVGRALYQGQADYIFLFGMDDFFSPKAITRYIEEMKKERPFIAMQGLYIYDTATQRILEVIADQFGNFPSPSDGPYLISRKKKSAFGAGRCIHRNLFRGHEFFWEPKRDRALDASMNRILNLPSPKTISPTTHTFVLDVKTKDNIWQFSNLIHRYADECLMPEGFQLTALPEWSDIQALTLKEMNG